MTLSIVNTVWKVGINKKWMCGVRNSIRINIIKIIRKKIGSLRFVLVLLLSETFTRIGED